jgi:predicted dehydrogenase
MNHVRWGLVSTANINRWLIPAIRESARGSLVAVASRDAERAEAYAREWEIPQAFASYEAMLTSGAVDAVYIGLPNHLHAEWSIKALRAGIHVLCEKPFALSLDEVDAMIAAARETDCILAEAFMYRHHPQTKLVERWVREGLLGDVTLVHGTFNFAFGSRDNIRLNPQMGGGSLWDVGVYPVSFAQAVMGEPPHSVSGFQWLGDTGVDEAFAGQLHYAGDRFAQIASSFRTPFHTRAEIIGTKGRLVVERPFVRMSAETPVTFFPAEGTPQQLSVPEKPLYLGAVEDMHAAILDGAPNFLTLAETRNHVHTVLALYRAASTAKVVRLSEVA